MSIQPTLQFPRSTGPFLKLQLQRPYIKKRKENRFRQFVVSMIRNTSATLLLVLPHVV